MTKREDGGAVFPFQMVFAAGDDFEAYRAAERWCSERGISVGSMERGAPIGLMVGDYAVAKWRNLSKAQRAELHGTLTSPTGSMRDGPVILDLKPQAFALLSALLAARAPQSGDGE